MRTISKPSGQRFAALSVLVVLAAVAALAGVAQASSGRGARPAGGPAAHTPYAVLTSVSCPSATECVAVGYHTIGNNPISLYPLAEAWNGTSWRLLKTPVIYGVLLGISCPRAAACIAVGSHETSGGNQTSALAAAWNGSSWRLLATAHTTVATDLASISCTGPGSCIAVSGYGDAEPVLNAAVEAWNGTSWRLLAIFYQSSLNGVACKSTTTCLAAGSTSPASDSWVPFAVAPKGTTWRPVATPPGDTGNLDTSLSAVSCATSTRCMAVGEGMLIDQWTGSGWKQLTAPGLGRLNGVSCLITTSCLAVGQNGRAQAAAQAWNGTAWRTLKPVLPRGPSSLSAVRCSAPARCMAVGFYGTTSTRYTLAERWNGTGWVRLKTPAS